jgi:hypothetical protein
MCGQVCPSRTSEREEKGYCVHKMTLCERRVARRRGACEGACEEECEPIPKPTPKTSSADVAERGVASMGVRSSGNLCVEEEYV